MTELAFRTDPVAAAKRVAELWPEDACLRAAAVVIADSIRHAHAQAPASWELTLFQDFLRLNVGQIAVLELFLDELVLYTTAGTARLALPYRRVKFDGYRAVNVATERWGVAPSQVATLHSELITRHRELIAVAARAKRISPFKKAHSPGAVVAVARLAGGQLPIPQYTADSTETSALDAVAGPVAEGLFGPAEQNAEVEQAAIQLVTKHLEAEGWQVRSVERDRRGYDLHCEQEGKELHVEVKGVREAATQFVMTAGEVRRADTDPHFALMIVANALGPDPAVERWQGRTFEREFQLEPLQYVARRCAT